jgi:hypothetical protein
MRLFHTIRNDIFGFVIDKRANGVLQPLLFYSKVNQKGMSAKFFSLPSILNTESIFSSSG